MAVAEALDILPSGCQIEQGKGKGDKENPTSDRDTVDKPMAVDAFGKVGANKVSIDHGNGIRPIQLDRSIGGGDRDRRCRGRFYESVGKAPRNTRPIVNSRSLVSSCPGVMSPTPRRIQGHGKELGKDFRCDVPAKLTARRALGSNDESSCGTMSDWLKWASMASIWRVD